MQYLEGQELDLTGGKITVFYSDGSSEIIDLTNERIEITGFMIKIKLVASKLQLYIKMRQLLLQLM